MALNWSVLYRCEYTLIKWLLHYILLFFIFGLTAPVFSNETDVFGQTYPILEKNLLYPDDPDEELSSTLDVKVIFFKDEFSYNDPPDIEIMILLKMVYTYVSIFC